MSTTAVCFPFDTGGGAGTSHGARLLADAVREMLADTRRETRPCRGKAYDGHVRVREVPFDTPADVGRWQRRGRAAARAAWGRGDFLLWLAGNHLAAMPLYEEIARDPGGLVVQLDAHLDVYHLHDTTGELSHGNFLRHLPGPRARVVNAGHRDLFLPPAEVAAYYHEVRSAVDFAADPSRAAARIRQLSRAADRVLIDIDCDVFDPAYAPAVGYPLPVGLTPAQVVGLIDAAWAGPVVGVCVSEFDPGRDRDDRTLGLLVWLLEYVLLRRYENPPPPPRGVT